MARFGSFRKIKHFIIVPIVHEFIHSFPGVRYARDSSNPDQFLIFDIDGNKGYPAGIQTVVPVSATNEALFNFTGSKFQIKGDFFGTEVRILHFFTQLVLKRHFHVTKFINGVSE